MIKTFNLSKGKGDHAYCVEKETKYIMCIDFVERCMGASPDFVTLTISTDPVEKYQKVLIIKTGYYRWNWYITEWNTGSGIYPCAEDILNKIFPNARIDGLDTYKELYISFK
jgi:hypothetical protein